MLKVLLIEDWAFVNLTDRQMLCIGTRKDVETYPDKLGEMVLEALAMANYQELNPARATRH